jgi:hypothetical protein
VIAKRLSSPLSFPSNKKQVRALDIEGTLLHNVSSNGMQRFRLVQVYDTLTPRLGTHTLWVIRAVSNSHAAKTVLYVFKVKVEYLTWTQPSLQHEQQHCLVSPLREGR